MCYGGVGLVFYSGSNIEGKAAVTETFLCVKTTLLEGV